MRTVAALVVALLLMSTAAEGQAPCASPAPRVTFDDGTWIVGTDIAPGTYRSLGPIGDVSCYWKRMSGFSGHYTDTIASDIDSGGPAVVTIDPTDAGFQSSGCGVWTLVA